jgi:26S proteasome regulatory subunit T5
MAAEMESTVFGDGQVDDFAEEVAMLSNEDLKQRIKALDNEVRIMKSDIGRIKHESAQQTAHIKDNKEKIKLNKTLPYLSANVIEIIDPYLDPEDTEEGSSTITSLTPECKGVVVKTSTRQTVFLPIPGLVRAEDVIPGELVGVNKDSYIVLEKLPTEFDSRVKAMEVDEKPTEDYTDIGGLDKQIQELIEAVVLPMTHADKFESIGIRAPKGVLLYGPPGTGKTLLARACAKQTEAVFLKLAGPQLVQMYIGDGAKLVRDAFDLAKEKIEKEGRKGAIIFIDEIDAIGTKRYGGEQSGDREVQRTMLELLNQLDGFSSNDKIKVIAATNRPDTLDPALLRSGRLDRKVELPHPGEQARAQIIKIHSKKMKVDFDDVNFNELARCTEDFNGAQLKAVAVESGMIALRREAIIIKHEDFMEAINVVAAKKKGSLDYYA